MKVRVQISGRQVAPKSAFKSSLTFSLVFHGVLFGLILFGGVLIRTTPGTQWGEGGGGGGHAVPVNLTPSIPLPETNAPKNPLASNTPEVNPAEPKRPVREEVRPPSPNDLQIKKRETRESLQKLQDRELERELANLRKFRDIPENAIPGTTSSGKASSQMYNMATSQGSAGMGFSGDFGTLYGYYVRAVRDCISRHWDQSRIDTSVRTAPKVYVEFDIQRDGTFKGERVATSSSIPTVDREALRAVQACSGRRDVGSDVKLPPLPADYSKPSVHVELWFEFKK